MSSAGVFSSVGLCDHRGVGHCGPQASQELPVKPTERQVPPTNGPEVHLHAGTCHLTGAVHTRPTCFTLLLPWCLQACRFCRGCISGVRSGGESEKGVRGLRSGFGPRRSAGGKLSGFHVRSHQRREDLHLPRSERRPLLSAITRLSARL